MNIDKRVEEFAKELSAKVRWSSGYGQYENDSKEQQAYVDGVTTAIGMMYIDLTGTPKSKGMLREYHQDLMSEVLKEIDEANWYMHLATKSRLKTFIKTIIKSK